MAGAKKEGKVVVNTFPGDGYKRALKAFTQAHPDIKLEHTGLHSQDFAPRILQERQANLFTWDVAMIPTSTALQVLRPAGVWDPVRPAVVLPEVTEDAGWDGGFERGFALIKDRALAYGFAAVRGAAVTVNPDLVKDEPVRGLTDLLSPKWKGKLLLPDVRVMGDAFWPMTSARLNLGDDIIKKLFVDQEPVLSRDTRQIAEFMVRGRYPIALGVNPLLLSQFQRQGLGKNLKLLHFPEMDTVNSSSSTCGWSTGRPIRTRPRSSSTGSSRRTPSPCGPGRSRRTADAWAWSRATRRSRPPRARSSCRSTPRRTCRRSSRRRTSREP